MAATVATVAYLGLEARAVEVQVQLTSGFGPALSGLIGALLLIPQLAVAVRRVHDLGKSGRELFVPCIMLLAVPLAFAFRGILPKIIALGFLGITLLAFANLL